MEDNSQKNRNASDQMREEVASYIRQYLKEAKKGKGYDQEMTFEVYSFLQNYEYPDYLSNFMIASVKALRVFATCDVGNNLKQIMGEYDFEHLCTMLENMVIFCNNVQENEIFMAEMEQIELATHKSCTPENVRVYKKKYQAMLKNLSDDETP